ncbi:MAG: hypothetical protein R3C19_17100 [Planctomycetaceae bacterium]
MRVLLILLLLSSAGCSSSQKLHLAAISGFDAGDPALAMRHLDEAAQARRAEADIIQLDQSMALLMSGSPEQAESRLRATRRQLDFLQQKDVGEQTAAVLSDDKAIAWSGRDYERRMMDSLLVLTNLTHGGLDAFAYSLQAIELAHADLADLAPKSHAPVTGDGQIVTVAAPSETVPESPAAPPPAPARFAPNALATYLFAALQSEKPMNADVTDRAIRQISYWQSASRPSTNLSGETAESTVSELVAFGNHTQQGNGVLHVITLAGRVTPWDEERAEPTSAALLIADRILSATGKHSLPPTIAPVRIAVPRRHFSDHPFRTVLSVESARDRGDRVSQVLVDLNQAAWDSFQSDRDRQLARAVARRVIKKAAVYTAKDQLAVSRNTGIDLLLNLGGVAWEALEKADTRYWSLLPERIEVIQAELPAGTHTIRLTTTASSTATGAGIPSVSLPVVIDDGSNTFVVCFRPSAGFAGQVLVGGTSPASVPAQDLAAP